MDFLYSMLNVVSLYVEEIIRGEVMFGKLNFSA